MTVVVHTVLVRNEGIRVSSIVYDPIQTFEARCKRSRERRKQAGPTNGNTRISVFWRNPNERVRQFAAVRSLLTVHLTRFSNIRSTTSWFKFNNHFLCYVWEQYKCSYNAVTWNLYQNYTAIWPIPSECTIGTLRALKMRILEGRGAR